MAFTQATAPGGLRNNEILSADNALPERHIVIATLRNAAPRLGLSPSVISTLDAMLSCLAPKRNHHTVFASNATLTFRLNGVSDRTVRRHAAVLQEAGLLVRHDSPNRKRFTKHSRQDGMALRFGFDLSPLFARLQEIAALAAEVLHEQEQIDYLRAKIRAAANALLIDNPDDEMAQNTLRLLRRKLALNDCQEILAKLADVPVQAETADEQQPVITTNMTDNDGQIVRHHHKSNKELIDKESTPITITELLTACPEANKFALHRIETAHDVIGHARTLAPMIGITNESYEAAHRRLGPLRAAATVWAILQFHSKIRKVGAYFRAITTGDKSAAFSPEALVRRLANAQLQLA
ncbi:plasmid replication protein RepC [Pseudorhodobacter aquimaris]|uniref:plasmid replication protein RepC n=1 Tax=Pseudorhodobacter aquimaris TaxID=687412 RepID=UPI00067DA5B1|nr:plasmid replication protein RepC [Pseudorhodobacter aquimaris]